MEKLRALQKAHLTLQRRIWRLEDVIRANERNLGKGNYQQREELEILIEDYKKERLDNNLARWNIVHGVSE